MKIGGRFINQQHKEKVVDQQHKEKVVDQQHKENFIRSIYKSKTKSDEIINEIKTDPTQYNAKLEDFKKNSPKAWVAWTTWQKSKHTNKYIMVI